jgi:hypothetical protein
VFDAADVLDVGKGEPPRAPEACLPTVRGA